MKQSSVQKQKQAKNWENNKYCIGEEQVNFKIMRSINNTYYNQLFNDFLT